MFSKAQTQFFSEKAAVQREFDKELLYLVQTKGWGYAQRVADDIVSEFNCKPTDPNWHTYTTIQYAFRRFFDGVLGRARIASNNPGAPLQSITAEIKETHATRSRSRRIDADASASSSKRGRKRTSK